MPTPARTSALTGEELAALECAESYPEDPSAGSGIERIETHLSQVFLTGERVYKFRRAVDLGFVKFTAREERDADCLREVTLNRRLAPDVYLGVASLCGSGRAVRVGPVRETFEGGETAPEHCVVMRRLEPGRDALSLLERGELRRKHVDALAERIARFHDEHGLGIPAPFAPGAWRSRRRRPVFDNLCALSHAPERVAPRASLKELRSRIDGFESDHDERFECRRRAGLAVDAHGDLHLQHAWFESDRDAPVVIDCLEFADRLRRIDAASEVAFLAMDLQYRGAPELAASWLGTYAAARDDFALYSVVDYFISYRAAVRAKVASIAAADFSIDGAQCAAAAGSARKHLELAVSALAPAGPGGLVLVGGAVGTGKSTVARGLAERLEGVVISSDRVRKRELGLAPEEAAPSQHYTPESKTRIYAGLVERAAHVVDSGRMAVLDATFGARCERERVLDWARRHGAPVFFVEAHCAPEVAMARLERRAAEGKDPSDAGPELHRVSAAGFAPLTDWPDGQRAAIETEGDLDAQLSSLAPRIRSVGS